MLHGGLNLILAWYMSAPNSETKIMLTLAVGGMNNNVSLLEIFHNSAYQELSSLGGIVDSDELVRALRRSGSSGSRHIDRR